MCVVLLIVMLLVLVSVSFLLLCVSLQLFVLLLLLVFVINKLLFLLFRSVAALTHILTRRHITRVRRATQCDPLQPGASTTTW